MLTCKNAHRGLTSPTVNYELQETGNIGNLDPLDCGAGGMGPQAIRIRLVPSAVDPSIGLSGLISQATWHMFQLTI
jgi:hypothetical protein